MYLPPDDTNFFIFGRHIIALCRLNRISNVQLVDAVMNKNYLLLNTASFPYIRRRTV